MPQLTPSLLVYADQDFAGRVDLLTFFDVKNTGKEVSTFNLLTIKKDKLNRLFT